MRSSRSFESTCTPIPGGGVVFRYTQWNSVFRFLEDIFSKKRKLFGFSSSSSIAPSTAKRRRCARR